jgi:hypothetical protein
MVHSNMANTLLLLLSTLPVIFAQVHQEVVGLQSNVIVIELQNPGRPLRAVTSDRGTACSEQVTDRLALEMYGWWHDELQDIFGKENFELGVLRPVTATATASDRNQGPVTLEATFDCKVCGQKQWTTDKSIHNVASLLQWFTQHMMEEWLTENIDIVEITSCMGPMDQIEAVLRIQKATGLKDQPVTTLAAGNKMFYKSGAQVYPFVE